MAADKSSGYPANYLKSKWRDYVKSTVLPDLAKPEYKALADELKQYPADFLYTLIG